MDLLNHFAWIVRMLNSERNLASNRQEGGTEVMEEDQQVFVIIVRRGTNWASRRSVKSFQSTWRRIEIKNVVAIAREIEAMLLLRACIFKRPVDAIAHLSDLPTPPGGRELRKSLSKLAKITTPA